MLSKYPWFFVGGRELGSDKGKISVLFLKSLYPKYPDPSKLAILSLPPPAKYRSNPLPFEGFQSPDP